jgi:hypothetical protein
VKFSIRQILASTAGAVAAAVIASIFGVKGTIVGVAIGSAAATMATAFVAQSIDRGHQAVKQVAIRAPESSSLLRRLGGTGASGDSASSVDASSAPTEVVGQPTPQGGDDADTVEMTSTAAATGAAGAAETERVPSPVAADAPATQRLQAATPPTQRAASRSVASGFSWRTIAAAAAIVFVLALLLVTAIELISGKPLSDIFGGAGGGTSLGNVVNPPRTPAPAPAPTTTSTTSTVSTTTTTTTASSTSTTTSTTAPTGSATTTTTAPAPSTTATTGPALSATTTTTASP